MSNSAETEGKQPVVIVAPPSKSLSHRYLTGAALARGISTVKHVLESADIEVTRGILCEAGARMKPLTGSGVHSADITGWEVVGMAGKPRGGTDKPLQCNVGESGTTCRLLTAVLAAGTGLFRIFGEGRMHDRPIGELCSTLASLGCGIAYEGKEGYPPFLIQAHGLTPGLVDGFVYIGMDDSSQYFSGLLLAAPMAATPLCIEVAGRKAISWPYVGLTLQCLEDFGIAFRVEKRARIGTPWIQLHGGSWRTVEQAKPGCVRVFVWPGEYKAGIYEVEGDWSQASYFLAAGALGQRPVTVRGLRANSLQGDRAILNILEKMGAHVAISEDSITVYPSALHGVDLDMGACPDLVPTVAVLASYATGSTRIRNVAHLRIKESDRIAAPAMELAKAGVTVDCLSDGLLINGMGGLRGHTHKGPDCPTLPDGAGLCAHNDHRIAMALALLGLRDKNLDVRQRLDHPEVVRKSCPDFWKMWSNVQ